MGKRARAVVGVMDHAGYAIVVTIAPSRDGAVLVDRRRVELVDPSLPAMPHHHEGQHMPIEDAVQLVARVRASAEAHARDALSALGVSVSEEIGAITLRVRPDLPATVAARIRDYRAMCVADWVMYREALADAATARGWRVHWYDAKRALADAATARASTVRALEALVTAAGKRAGAPWQKDHKLAMAAALAVPDR